MENHNAAYERAKKKVETLKGFYHHLFVFLVVNLVLILVNAEVFNPEPDDFSDWGNYVTTFFWGIGLFCHGLYVCYVLHFGNNFLKRWEDKKMREYLDKDEF